MSRTGYNPDQPYASRRSPVAARNLVATSQPLATQAGLSAMRDGGNAVDAALAAAITLTVVEPNNNGVGSDAFALYWDGHALHGLNASGAAPAGWSPERFAGLSTMPTFGWDAVTVPGCVSAWAALSERFGELSFERLFDDAIHYAQHGFHVGPITALHWQQVASTYAGFGDFAEHFLPAPQPGELVRRPDLAASLKRIAASDGEDFYRGELARRIVAASEAAGGAMVSEDLARHELMWVEPTAQAYHGVTLHEIPPNGQGLAAQIALGILAHLPDAPLQSEIWLHQQIEAMKIAVRAAQDHIADPHHMQIGTDELLAPEGLAQAAAGITDRAAPLPPMRLPVGQDTVYLCAADAGGRMVSYIQSNYLAFGSGIVIPGTGIAMQNRGAGFSLEPGHPNSVGPSKRPFHTIIPGFVTRDGVPELAFGVMGGHMQHQGHVQMVTRLYDHGQNPQAAIDAPRWHVRPDFSVALETVYGDSICAALAQRGHQVALDDSVGLYGGAQLIQRIDQGYVGGSDPRKEGQVSGF